MKVFFRKPLQIGLINQSYCLKEKFAGCEIDFVTG